MILEQVLNYSITIFSLVAMIFAWLAKIKWSKEFKEAKEAEIKAKEAQIDLIREKVELYESVISQKLIEYSKKTIKDLERLVCELEESKQNEINKILDKLKDDEDIFNLEKSKNEKKSLLQNLSHEFRIPIYAIIGFCQLLTEENINKEKKEEYINFIKKSAFNMASVLDDVVNLNK